MQLFTLEQLEQKKKIVILILLVLTEKAKKVSKTGDLKQVIETAIDLVVWLKEYAILIRNKPFKPGGTSYIVNKANFDKGEDVILKYLKKNKNIGHK